jgi:HPt (histidine-containing phosphotransfer) domain-containing protein
MLGRKRVMSVRELQNALRVVAQDAENHKDALVRFLRVNEDELSEAMRALDGTTTDAAADVRSTLNEARSSLESAIKSMASAAQAARDFANRI